MSVKNYAQLLSDKEKQYALPVGLLSAMADQESGGDAKARSPKGAGGLLQLMPDTAKEMGVDDVNDPEQNADGGAKYMRLMLDQHNGDVPLALAAYNAGPAAVAEHGGIPPYPETQDYVAKITGKLGSQSDAPSGYEEVPAGYEEVSDNSAPAGYEDVPQGYEEAPSAQAMAEPKADIASITPKTTAQRVLGGLGALEAPVSMASAVPAASAGGLAFLGWLGKAALPEFMGGIPSTSSYVDYAKGAQEATQNAMTYAPASAEGQRTLGGIGAGMEAIGGAINAPVSAVRGLGAMAKGGDFSKSYQQGQQEGLAENLGIGLSSAAKGLGAGEPIQAGAYALGKTLPDAAMWTAPYLAKGAGVTTKAAANAASNIIKPIPETAQTSKIIGQIMQGKREDIPQYRKALSQIDRKDIASPDDIVGKLTQKTDQAMGAVNSILDKHTAKYSGSQLEQVVSKDGDAIKQNFVKDAIIDLRKNYQVKRDAASVARMDALMDRIQPSTGIDPLTLGQKVPEGITPREINDLAKEHGTNLNAFTPDGKINTEVQKGLEATRSGLKKTVRGIVNDPSLKALDESAADLIKTKDQLSLLSEQANRIDQRMADLGIVGKAWNKAVRFTRHRTHDVTLDEGSYNAKELADLVGKRLSKLEKIVNAPDVSIARKKFIIEKMQQGALSTPAAMENHK